MPANGPKRLAAIAAELRAAGDRGNTLALRAGLRAAAKPLVPAVKDAALAQLPKRGGLNRRVAGQRVSVRTRLTARYTDVRLTTRDIDTRETDEGYVRHPDIGYVRYPRSYWKWSRQELPRAKGWWTKTLRREAPAVRASLIKAIDGVAAKIGRVG